MASNNVMIYYQNCRGIRTKLHTLYMNKMAHAYDVIILTETWLIPSIQDSEFIDNRYIVFRCDRDRSATKKHDGGGVLVAVLRELRPTKLTTYFVNPEVEHVVVLLPASQHNKRHIISATYIPPRMREELYTQYLDMLQGLVNAPATDSYFIVGDFNLPDIAWLDQENHAIAQVSDTIGRLLMNFMNLINGLQFNVTKNKLGRILDLLISNVDCQAVSCNALLDPDSHHPAISALTCLNTQYTPLKCCTVHRHNFHKANYDAINYELSKIDWGIELSHLGSEQAVNVFYEALYGIIKLHVPLTRTKNSSFPVWFSPSLIRIFKSKERAWIKWKTYNNQSNYLKFSNYRKLFHSESIKCYKKYIKSVEDSIPKNIKHFWTYISSRKGKANYPASMYFKNVSSDDPTDICNLFSAFFSSVYEPSSFDPEKWQPSDSFADNSSCISDINLSVEVIRLKLKSLDSSKGAGPDGLPPDFFIKTCDTLCNALNIIFNKCLCEGVFPAIWKRAFITPIHKAGDKNNVENYRPISILSTLSKVFESLVHSALYPHIHQLIIPEQHGFVKRRSTATNLLVFTNYLFEKMDRRVQVDAVYTDFQKAFDKVDHLLLLEKIAFNGIRGNLLRWFASYIFNRTQRTVVNGFESEPVVVKSGVPQGSILGPLLFIIFINDFKSCLKNSNFLMYADDVKVYRSCKNTLDCVLLQDDLDRLYAYCIKNKLFLSLPKCHSISFTKNKKVIHHNYYINGARLGSVVNVRDLGITLDSRLHFDIHVDNIINKAFRMYGFVMRSSGDFVRPSTFLLLYKTLIRSQLEYAIQIWNPLYDKYCSRLEMVQKKFLRSMNYKCFNSKVPYVQLLKRYGVLSLESRRMLLDAMTLHGLCNNKFDCIELTNQLCLRVPRTVVQRGVRVPRLFHTHLCKTNAGMRAPLRRLVETYNTHFMELDIFTLSKQVFKKKAIEILSK